MEVGESEKRTDTSKTRVKKCAKMKTLKLSDGQELKLPDTGRNSSYFPGVYNMLNTMASWWLAAGEKNKKLNIKTKKKSRWFTPRLYSMHKSNRIITGSQCVLTNKIF